MSWEWRVCCVPCRMGRRLDFRMHGATIKVINTNMFRTSQGPSSGSHELRLTEVTSIVSVLAVALCMVSVWLHILTLGVCVCCTGQRFTPFTGATDTHTSPFCELVLMKTDYS
jgi:hypothetical protein